METLAVAVLVLATAAAPADDAAALEPFATFVAKHCLDCHKGKDAEAGLDLARLGTNLANAENMRRWTLAHDRVALGEMPPKDYADIKPAERKQALDQLADALNRADRRQREVILRRLNRVEYQNTLRDLFNIRVNVVDMLPEDAKKGGFDNIGSALAISTEQMEAYLKAADIALDEAFGEPKPPKKIELRYPLIKDCERNIDNLFRKDKEGVVLFSSGYCPSTMRSFRPQTKGTYRVKIHAKAIQTDKPLVMAVYGGDVITKRRPHHLVGHFDIAPGKWTTVEFTDFVERFDTFHPVPFKLWKKNGQRFEGPGLLIGDVEVEGPLEEYPPPSRRKLLQGIDPAKGTLKDAETILARVLPMAFRRRVNPEEVQPYVTLTRAALDAGRGFEDALRIGLKAVLCSPEFLYIEERGAAANRKTIDDYALANRLSYLLWSSMPDEQLFELAAQSKLSDAGTLRKQTERMLRDPKAAAFVDNFAGQWLGLRDIDFTEPDQRLYPEYDDLLRASMVQESKLYFREVLDNNLSLLEFVDSDWTMLNQRLAEHYEIKDVVGQEFRKVKLPADSVRGGVLTQASVLKITANGTNTSPVVRGVWVLEKIVGKPTPPPPPNVPALEPDIRGAVTIREQLDKHRSIASCAACHAKIDPPGFALEMFDVIGGYRDWYRSAGEGERVDRYIDDIGLRRVQYRKGRNVDGSGQLPDGQRFADVRAFKKLLLRDADQIARCLTEKLLTYGTGRTLGFSDRAAVHDLVARARAEKFGFRSLLHEVIQSETFRQP
ncbi:MAG: DUF1592 domain-containing protein [Gemmataceae bacterium]